jgi:phosphoribosylformylglycinamidine cyclo-ligase
VIKRYGQVPDTDMLRTFNMGVGITMVVKPSALPAVTAHLRQFGCEAYVIGEIVEGNQTVVLEGQLQYP